MFGAIKNIGKGIFGLAKGLGKDALAIGRATPGIAMGATKAGLGAAKTVARTTLWQADKGLLGVSPGLGSKLIVGGGIAAGAGMLAYNMVNHSYNMRGRGVQFGSNPLNPYKSTMMDFSYRTNYRSMNASGDLALALHNLR